MARCLGDYCRSQKILPEKQYSVGLKRSTVDQLFVAPTSFKNWDDERGKPLCLDFVDLQKGYHSVDQALPGGQALARADDPNQTMTVILRFHDGMLARVRMGDGVF